ncbi:MAG: ribonuclease PH [Alphaproteobacteria bacterium]|nr:ribonuclease PH [Alphaproteobacteria bacterium]
MRADGRAPDALRPLTFETGLNVHAEGSCLVRMGRTHVWVTATVEESVPRWRRDSGQGWVTAEYRMLPRSTTTRNRRDGMPPGGRVAEIQRLVGRSLRAAVDYAALGERQVLIDCDVLQADGGTRTASINGGFVALALALQGLVDAGKLDRLPLVHGVAAVSVALQPGGPVLDPDYSEDAGAEVDLNLVMTGGGQVVEVQGCAEGSPIAQATLTDMVALGALGIAQVARAQAAALPGLALHFPMGGGHAG